MHSLLVEVLILFVWSTGAGPHPVTKHMDST